MGQPARKLQKRNPNPNASTTRLVRNNTTRSTLTLSTPTSATFPSSIYDSSPITYPSTSSIPNASISRALTPIPTPTSPLSPLGQHELNRLSDIIDPLEVLNEHFAPIPATPPNSTAQTPSSSPLALSLSPASDTDTFPSSTSPRPRHIPIGNRAIVHSPSGNAFGIHEFVAHTERPLAMWERQARIISATQQKIRELEEKESQSRLGFRRTESRMTLREKERKFDAMEVVDEGHPIKTSKLRRCCSVFGFLH